MSKVSRVQRTLIGLGCWVICAAASALEINQANEAELDSLKGMGPTLSRHVLDARAQGAFQNWADMRKRVSGMGRGKAKQFSAQGLTVNGQPFSEVR